MRAFKEIVTNPFPVLFDVAVKEFMGRGTVGGSYDEELMEGKDVPPLPLTPFAVPATV